MNHKRKRPKNRRAGCLMCKPQKMNHARMKDRDPISARRRMLPLLPLLLLLLMLPACSTPPEDRLTRIQSDLVERRPISYDDLRWLAVEQGNEPLADIFTEYEARGVPATDHWSVAMILSGAVRDVRR